MNQPSREERISLQCECGQKMSVKKTVLSAGFKCPNCEQPVKLTKRRVTQGKTAGSRDGQLVIEKLRAQIRTLKWICGLLGICVLVLIALNYRNDPQIKSPEGELTSTKVQTDDVVESESKKDTNLQPLLGYSKSDIEVAFEGTGIEFEPVTTPDGLQTNHRASLRGVHITLWGDPDNLQAVSVIGSFEGEYGTDTGTTLALLLNLLTPSWGADERSDWMVKASEISNHEMDVSTYKDEIVVQMVSTNLDNHWIRTISFRRQ